MLVHCEVNVPKNNFNRSKKCIKTAFFIQILQNFSYLKKLLIEYEVFFFLRNVRYPNIYLYLKDVSKNSKMAFLPAECKFKDGETKAENKWIFSEHEWCFDVY